jgi:hypothetical protein
MMTTFTTRLPGRATITFLVALVVLAAPGARGDALPAYASRHRFEEFAVPRETVANPAIPRIEGREAKLYRTQIRRAARKPADFAGHLRVARWGCGTCCQQFAIVDLRTGKVSFPGFTISCGLNPRDPVQSDAGLFYRADSRLFVVSGIRNEGRETGVWYYQWSNGGLSLLEADVPARPR